jgi:hypothetical protein
MGKVPESSQQEPVVDFVVAARWVGMNTILVYLMAASGAFFERAQVGAKPRKRALASAICLAITKRSSGNNLNEL